MSKSLNWWTRKCHRWVAVLAALPLLIVIVSGLLLQLKKQVAWVQPPTVKGSTQSLALNWNQILTTAQSVPLAQVNTWDDVLRLDVQPSIGLIKVQCKNGWELQLDAVNAAVLSSAYRRSDWIERIHDGSFFSQGVKLGVFLPNGLGLLLLWISGVYLWYLPWKIRRQKMIRQIRKGHE